MTRPERGEQVSLLVALIQFNILQSEKWDSQLEDMIFQRLDLLTRAAALSSPDLIVWPESATPRGIFSDELNYKFVREQLRHGDYSLLLGTVLSDPEANGEY